MADSNQPNIVVIFVDDMGWGDLLSNLPAGTDLGYRTPNLDQMATEGMRFTHFYSASAVCSPARAALLTGCYPQRVSMPAVLFPDAQTGLNPDETTLAELVKQEGYATGMFGKWHLGDHPSFLPHNQGFDQFLGLPYSNDLWPRNRFGTPVTDNSNRASWPELPLIENNVKIGEITSLTQQDSLTQKYTEGAVDFINAQATAGTPFFLYLPHSMPHVPLAARQEFRSSATTLYGAVMEEIDWSVGQVMDALAANGIEDDTWVIFTSDNGPWLRYGNHGGSAGQFRDGKATAFEGGFRMPCLMKWPGVIPAGRINARIASTIDIFPTVAAYIGADLPDPATHPIDGVDISALMENGFAGGRIRDEFAYYRRGELAAMRAGVWKYVFPQRYDSITVFGNNGSFGQATPVQFPGALYNVVQDPGETTDRQAEFPNVVADLRARAQALANEIGNQGGGGQPFRDRDIPITTGTQIRPPGRVGSGSSGLAPGATPNDVFYQTGSATKIEQLVGDYDKQRREVTRNFTESRYGLARTDLGVPFPNGDSDTTWVYFGDDFVAADDPIAFTTDQHPEDGIDLEFLTDEDGRYQKLEIEGVNLLGFGVPLDGVTRNGNIYLYTAQLQEGTSQLSISTDKGKTHHKLYDFSDDKFNNISLFQTTATDGYPEAPGTDIQVLFGAGEYRQSNVVLAYQPLETIEDKSTVRYFTGLDNNGKPFWSTQESDAVDLFEQACVGELSVAYNNFINKWIMLYNCGNPRGVNCRTADQPWGPWSDPFVVFNDRADDGYCEFIHSNWQFERCDSIHDVNRENVWGGSYGPYMFDRMSTGNDQETTLYFTLSTWNPYTSLLMKTTIVKDTSTFVPAGTVDVNFAQLNMEVSQFRTLQATVGPRNAFDKSVTWSVADPTVATVNTTGGVRAIAVGQTTVYGTTANGLVDSTEISVSTLSAPTYALAPGLYTLRAQHSNRALDNSGFPNTNRTNVVQFDFNNLAFQKWQFDTIGEGYYRITALSGGLALSLENCAGTANGNNVLQRAYDGSTCQQWQVVQLPNGNYRIVSRSSGLSLEVNGTNNNNSNVQQWAFLDFNHQKWNIQPTGVFAVTGISLNLSTLDLELGQSRRVI
ncbi:MAG: sulfatase-like hydrolase/transferase, partial [Bacteroidota bacterium]